LLIRLSQRQDEATLRSFTCASAAWYEREVETYIRTIIAPRVEESRRVLLVEDDEEIVAVAAHREANDPGGTGLVVSWLEVAAVRLDRQGTSLVSGTKLSATLMTALIADAIRQPGREPIVAAYVAEQNRRSRAVCARAGLVEDPPPDLLYSEALGADTSYIFVTGAFRLRAVVDARSTIAERQANLYAASDGDDTEQPPVS
jgi:hypothetical protein